MLCPVVLDSGTWRKEIGLGPDSFIVMVPKALATEYLVIDLVHVHGLLPCPTNNVGTAIRLQRAGIKAMFWLWSQQAESRWARAEIRPDVGTNGEVWTYPLAEVE